MPVKPRVGLPVNVVGARGAVRTPGKLRLLDTLMRLGPLAIWPLPEVGGTTIQDISGHSYNGVYSNVTLNAISNPFGEPAPLWVPASVSFGNVYSAALAAAFTGAQMNNCTLAIFWKARAASVLTDTKARFAFRFAVNSSNQIFIQKSAVNNTINLTHIGAGTTRTTTLTVSDTNWHALVISVSGGINTPYKDGVAGSALSGCGTATGSINANFAQIGSISTIGGADDTTDGYLAYAALYTPALTPAQIALIKPPT